MIDLREKIVDYLKQHVPNFQVSNKKGKYLFTCPNDHRYKKDKPSAMFIGNGTPKIFCLECGYKCSLLDVVRFVEGNKRNWDDAQITEYLINSLKLNVYKELEAYKEYNWSLLDIARNGKDALEKTWQHITHYEKVDWIKWLNNGLNIGVRTGDVSGITVIDVDNKSNIEQEEVRKIREKIITLLETSTTLMQNSPNGKHFVFQYDSEIPQFVNLGNIREKAVTKNGLYIDSRNDGGYILIQPSKRDNREYNWQNLGIEIKPIPKEVKEIILDIYENKNKTDESIKDIEIPDILNQTELREIAKKDDKVNTLKEHDGRNSLLMSLGGKLSHRLDIRNNAEVLYLISETFFEDPLSKKEIIGVLEGLDQYRGKDAYHIEQTIYDFIKQMGDDITPTDIKKANPDLNEAIIYKYLSKFKKEGKVIKLGRGRYRYKEKIVWSDEALKEIDEYPYKMPYFNDIMYFAKGDILLLGAAANKGKTTFALNMIKQMIEQGVKPYYLYLESGSRFQKTSKFLGITGKYFHAYHANPLSIEIEPDSFTIIDWLHIGDKSYTDSVYKHLNDEMQRKGGILVVLNQLKEDNTWFALNLIKQFPTFAGRYIHDTDDGTETHWIIDKIKESKGNYTTYRQPCKYDPQTKIISISKDLI